jgi:hypothetical protein
MFNEIDDIIECIPYLDRGNWEQCRLNTYVTSMIDHKKVKINEFLPFPWESNKVTKPSKGNIEISSEDIKRLKELEKQWSKHG